ncbi:response regulator transcription factor [Shewanella jiangmenensis]|nr:response regulator [Shewanella jiangmenensis]
MVVEDDLAYGAALCRRLSRHGFECCHVSEPTEALLCARSWQPSHVLLDMKLEQSSGLKLITPLRASLPAANIVLLTGFASIATAVEAVKLGADNYLAKPVDSQTLLATLLPEAKRRGGAEEENSPLAQHEQTADVDESLDAPMSPRRLEWEHIQQVLAANEGNVSATARQLGMHRRTLQRKLAKKP